MQEDRDYLSRLLPIGHELCILPKTCLNTFRDKQPVYELGEAFQLGHGGSWADPPQVASRPHLCHNPLKPYPESLNVIEPVCARWSTWAGEGEGVEANVGRGILVIIMPAVCVRWSSSLAT
jgi:hypothetical protein